MAIFVFEAEGMPLQANCPIGVVPCTYGGEGLATCELTLFWFRLFFLLYNISDICCFTSERKAIHSIGECLSRG